MTFETAREAWIKNLPLAGSRASTLVLQTSLKRVDERVVQWRGGRPVIIQINMLQS